MTFLTLAFLAPLRFSPHRAPIPATHAFCAARRRSQAPRFRAEVRSCIKRPHPGMDVHSMRVPFFAASTVLARSLVPTHVA